MTINDWLLTHQFNGWFVVFAIMAIINLARGHWWSTLFLLVATFELGVK